MTNPSSVCSAPPPLQPRLPPPLCLWPALSIHATYGSGQLETCSVQLGAAASWASPSFLHTSSPMAAHAHNHASADGHPIPGSGAASRFYRTPMLLHLHTRGPDGRAGGRLPCQTPCLVSVWIKKKPRLVTMVTMVTVARKMRSHSTEPGVLSKISLAPVSTFLEIHYGKMTPHSLGEKRQPEEISRFFSARKIRYELLSGPHLQFRHHRDKRLSYYTKSSILIAFKIVHQIKSPACCRNEISVVLTIRKGTCVGTVGSFRANVKFQFMKKQSLKAFPLLFYSYPTFYSSITDAGPIVLESAGYHFEVWQGPIFRWRLHVIAYDRMLPTPSPEGWKLERPPASPVLLLSPSHRWTWTRLVLEAEQGQ